MAHTAMFSDQDENTMRRTFKERCHTISTARTGTSAIKRMFPDPSAIPLLVIGELSERYQLSFDTMIRIVYNLP